MAAMLRAMPSPFRIPVRPFGSTCRIYPNHRDLNPAALIWQEVNEGLKRRSASGGAGGAECSFSLWNQMLEEWPTLRRVVDATWAGIN
jgi:hypothetical protein